MKKYPAFIVAVLAIVTGAQARADLLVLDTGESLSGRLVRIREGVLVFRTDLAGQMMVPMDTVRALSNEANVMVTLTGGDVLYGRFNSNESGPSMLPLEGGEPRPLDLAQVQEALPIPTPPAPPDVALPKLEGARTSVETGVQWHSGSSDRTEPYARLKHERTAPGSRLESELYVERDDPDYFPATARGRALWTADRGQGIGPYVDLDVERDRYAGLDARTGLSLGLAKVFADDDRQQAETRAGIGAAYEAWDNTALGPRRAGHGWDNDSSSGAELHAQLGLRYSRALFGQTQVRSNLWLYPSLTDLGSVRARSETAFLWPLSSRLRLRLNLQIDYDNAREVDGVNQWETALGAGFHWDF